MKQGPTPKRKEAEAARKKALKALNQMLALPGN